MPVLSSRRTSTSPAASMAQPLMASTLAWFRRLMPAMPIADSRAPMVVGARQISSATNHTHRGGIGDIRQGGGEMGIGVQGCGDQNKDDGKGHQQDFQGEPRWGSFSGLPPPPWRSFYPGKLCPASWVTRTTSQSESTVVPPVTAERSPPASRMTGADSPVMALSSTLAAPSTHLAVCGDLLPGVYQEQIPSFEGWRQGRQRRCCGCGHPPICGRIHPF